MDIVIASNNLHKIREIREMLKGLKRIDFFSLLNFPDYIPPVENGKTFKENASLKALHASKVLKKWVIADDSGLVIPALNGAPGIRSKRYAGDDATDAENRLKLLTDMGHLENLQRSAYFECSLALAGPDGLKKSATGNCEGFIIKEERGRNGFGYDAIFVKNEYDKTFAEIDEATKNRISHRRKAIEKLLPTLERMK